MGVPRQVIPSLSKEAERFLFPFLDLLVNWGRSSEFTRQRLPGSGPWLGNRVKKNIVLLCSIGRVSFSLTLFLAPYRAASTPHGCQLMTPASGVFS